MSESREVERQSRQEFVAGLRAMADLFENDGPTRLPIPQYGVTVSLDASVKIPSAKPGAMPWDTEVDQPASLRQLKRIVRGMGRGRKQKVFEKERFSCIKDLGGKVTLRVEAGRTVICKPVQTGRTIFRPAQFYSTPGRVEEEVEWVCDETLLGRRKDA